MVTPPSGFRVHDQLQQSYSNHYETGPSEWRWLGARDKAANIIALCSDVPHGRILEIGAGDGAILQQLAESQFGESLAAVEIVETAVDAIRARRIPRLRDCRTFDGYTVPFDGDSYDLVILTHVLEHVEYPRRLLYEARRVAPHVFAEVPLENTLRLKPDFLPDAVGHINFYSRKTFRRELQTCGLTVLRQIVSNPSRRSYVYRSGSRGNLSYCIKECALRVLPALATSIWTYHSAILSRRDDAG